MRVLVACEFSGVVRDAFIRRGFDAVSCDLLPSEAPGPHYQGGGCFCEVGVNCDEVHNGYRYWAGC